MTGKMVLEVRGIFIRTLFCTLCSFLTAVTAAVESETLLGRVKHHSKGDITATSAQLWIRSHATQQVRSKG